MKDAIGLSLLLLFGAWAMNYDVASRNYNTEYQAVNNLTYRYTQVAGKKGILSTTIYEELEKNLALYGEYTILVIAERFNEDGTIDSINNGSVIDLDLRENGYDLLSIYVKEDTEHLLSKVFEVSPLGSMETDIYLAAKSTVYIQ